MRIQRILPTLAALLLLSLSTQAAFGDDLADGKKLYAAHDYNKAAEAFKRATVKNRGDYTPHYYLANCYVAKKDWGEAKAEYQYAAQLTRDDAVKDYCHSVIASLEARNNGFRNKDGSLPGAVDGGGFNSQILQPNAGQLLEARGEQEAIRSTTNTERLIQEVQNERNQALAPLQGVNRAGTAVSTPEEQAAVSASYDQRIEALRAQGRHQSEAIRQQAEQSARRTGL